MEKKLQSSSRRGKREENDIEWGLVNLTGQLYSLTYPKFHSSWQLLNPIGGILNCIQGWLGSWGQFRNIWETKQRIKSWISKINNVQGKVRERRSCCIRYKSFDKFSAFNADIFNPRAKFSFSTCLRCNEIFSSFIWRSV